MKQWKFPAGEIGVQVDTIKTSNHQYRVNLDFRSSDDIISMLMQVDAIRRVDNKAEIILDMPYIPYARQDRVMQLGESHSLKVFADLVNSCGFTKVKVVDPHSTVSEALFNNLSVITQAEAFITKFGDDFSYDYLIAPDSGALKKVYNLSSFLGIPVVCAGKSRDVSTGKITGTLLSEQDLKSLDSKKILVVDDICDGGATFIELAKIIPPDCNCDLYVTHGIFSKGKELLLEYYDQIMCYNDMSSI